MNDYNFKLNTSRGVVTITIQAHDRQTAFLQVRKLLDGGYAHLANDLNDLVYTGSN